MKLLKIISKRRSVRQFLPDNIEQEKLEYLLECARLAPSAVNFQPWKFLIIKSPEKQALLRQCYNREWFAGAPLYIIALGDMTQSWKRKSDNKDHLDIDVTIAFEHIILAATELGLGTCWVCNFDMVLCRKLFNLPEHMIPVAITPIGYPVQDEEEVSNRKSLQEITKII